jgi:hypothetical protein
LFSSTGNDERFIVRGHKFGSEFAVMLLKCRWRQQAKWGYKKPQYCIAIPLTKAEFVVDEFHGRRCV